MHDVPVFGSGWASGAGGAEQGQDTCGTAMNFGKVLGSSEQRGGMYIASVSNLFQRQRKGAGGRVGTDSPGGGPACSFSYKARCSSVQNVPFSSIRRIAKEVPQ